MPDTVNGLPLHPLVVHAVVVLLPLACLGVIAVALRGAWRARYGALVVLLTAVATAAIPVATSSGENLERRVGNPGEHAELGDSLIWFALPLLVVSVALVLLHRRTARAVVSAPASAPVAAPATVGSPVTTSAASGAPAAPAETPAAPTRSPVAIVVAVLAVVIAVATLVQVYRVGDSGARVVWQGTVSSQTGDR
ncbi:hypothetical protein HC031_11250 [Planosporangium thailandense]|uniref:DUF2231 domain-containing protein n=1 Tax=Planosporangium thailandense TaxID=765197 RepID=A0ABX0XWK4_9ACTN|nr:DUF2231 domain-containing protein [Planosporangium thailandense]NJC70282.1 hypothetical protein [Planosporangium thailandense]